MKMKIYGHEITSRLLLGTAQYPSPAVLGAAIRESGSEIITVSLRRETADGTGPAFGISCAIWAAGSCPTPPAAIRYRRP